jgi:hypothetical protein
MIVLDEELQGLGLDAAIARWYRGSVLVVKQLRPGTVIKDEAIPTLLRRADQPTFVTINHGDFWRRIPAESSFCLVCFKLTADQAPEIPVMLRRLLRVPEFRTKRERMGKVASVGRRGIQYYSNRDKLIHAVAAVESELNQFISLADKGNLKQEFEYLFDAFENAQAVPNSFALAVDRSIQIGGQLKKWNFRWQHGVLVCYKTRSAIVHAGLSSPIFDAYPDGPACLDMLLPHLESIGLKYLKITSA